MKYYYERNFCSCHPETCCCHNYKIMFDKTKVATAFDEEAAKDTVDKLNKEK
jgi:hypothetical protein